MFAPIMFNFTGRKALVVGAGPVGLSRARKLKDYGCQVTVIAPEITGEKQLLEGLNYIKKSYNPAVLKDFDIVVAATADKNLNRNIIYQAENAGITLTNSVTLCREETLMFPAAFNRAGIWVSVSSSGVAPGLTKKLREALETMLSQNFIDSLKEETPAKRLKPAKSVYKLGTRGSQLALAQAQSVKDKLETLYPQIVFEIKVIQTAGDADQSTPLKELPKSGVFFKEIEKALLNGEIDFAVHSMKDLGLKQPEGLILTENPPERVFPLDVMLVRKDFNPDKPFTLGTGSARRALAVKDIYPNALPKTIRGNVNTRIKKLIQGDYDAVVLAWAGLIRLGITEESLKRDGLEPIYLGIVPAPRQGILALEYREEDKELGTMLESIGDPVTGAEARFETAFLEAAGGADCSIPVGARCRIEEDELTFDVFLGDDNGNFVTGGFRMKQDLNTILEDKVKNLAESLKKQLEVKGGFPDA